MKLAWQLEQEEREREEQRAKEQQENSGLLHDLGTYVDANVANYKSIDAAGEWNDAAQRLANKDYNSDEEFRDLMAKVQNSEAEQQIYNQEYQEKHNELKETSPYVLSKTDQFGGTMQGMRDWGLGAAAGAAIGGIAGGVFGLGAGAVPGAMTGAKIGGAFGGAYGGWQDNQSNAIEARQRVLAGGGSLEQGEAAYQQALIEGLPLVAVDTFGSAYLGAKGIGGFGRMFAKEAAENAAKRGVFSTLENSMIGRGISKLSNLDIPERLGESIAYRTGMPLAGRAVTAASALGLEGLGEGAQEVGQNFVTDRAVNDQAKYYNPAAYDPNVSNPATYNWFSPENKETFVDAAMMAMLPGAVSHGLNFKGPLQHANMGDAQTIQYGKDIASSISDGSIKVNEERLQEAKDYISRVAQDIGYNTDEIQKMDAERLGRFYVDMYGGNSLGYGNTKDNRLIAMNDYINMISDGHDTVGPQYVSEASKNFFKKHDYNIGDTSKDTNVLIDAAERQAAEQGTTQQATGPVKDTKQNTSKTDNTSTTEATQQAANTGVKETSLNSNTGEAASEGPAIVAKGKVFQNATEKVGSWRKTVDETSDETYANPTANYIHEENGKTARIEYDPDSKTYDVYGSDESRPIASFTSQPEAEKYLSAHSNDENFSEQGQNQQETPDNVTKETDGDVANNDTLTEPELKPNQNNPNPTAVHGIKDLNKFYDTMKKKFGARSPMDPHMFMMVARALMRNRDHDITINMDLDNERTGQTGNRIYGAFNRSSYIDPKTGTVHAILSLYKGADAVTALHEMGHVGWMGLNEIDRNTFNKYARGTEAQYVLRWLGMEYNDENVQKLMHPDEEMQEKIDSNGIISQTIKMLTSTDPDEINVCVEERFAHEFSTWYMEGYLHGQQPANIIQRILNRVCASLNAELELLGFTAEYLHSDGWQKIKVDGKEQTLPKSAMTMFENYNRQVPSAKVAPTVETQAKEEQATEAPAAPQPVPQPAPQPTTSKTSQVAEPPKGVIPLDNSFITPSPAPKPAPKPAMPAYPTTQNGWKELLYGQMKAAAESGKSVTAVKGLALDIINKDNSIPENKKAAIRDKIEKASLKATKQLEGELKTKKEPKAEPKPTPKPEPKETKTVETPTPPAPEAPAATAPEVKEEPKVIQAEPAKTEPKPTEVITQTPAGKPAQEAPKSSSEQVSTGKPQKFIGLFRKNEKTDKYPNGQVIRKEGTATSREEFIANTEKEENAKVIGETSVADGSSYDTLTKEIAKLSPTELWDRALKAQDNSIEDSIIQARQRELSQKNGIKWTSQGPMKDGKPFKEKKKKKAPATTPTDQTEPTTEGKKEIKEGPSPTNIRTFTEATKTGKLERTNTQGKSSVLTDEEYNEAKRIFNGLLELPKEKLQEAYKSLLNKALRNQDTIAERVALNAIENYEYYKKHDMSGLGNGVEVLFNDIASRDRAWDTKHQYHNSFLDDIRHPIITTKEYHAMEKAAAQEKLDAAKQQKGDSKTETPVERKKGVIPTNKSYETQDFVVDMLDENGKLIHKVISNCQSVTDVKNTVLNSIGNSKVKYNPDSLMSVADYNKLADSTKARIQEQSEKMALSSGANAIYEDFVKKLPRKSKQELRQKYIDAISKKTENRGDVEAARVLWNKIHPKMALNASEQQEVTNTKYDEATVQKIVDTYNSKKTQTAKIAYKNSKPFKNEKGKNFANYKEALARIEKVEHPETPDNKVEKEVRGMSLKGIKDNKLVPDSMDPITRKTIDDELKTDEAKRLKANGKMTIANLKKAIKEADKSIKENIEAANNDKNEYDDIKKNNPDKLSKQDKSDALDNLKEQSETDIGEAYRQTKIQEELQAELDNRNKSGEAHSEQGKDLLKTVKDKPNSRISKMARTLYQLAVHATPHIFDGFDLKYINTGERCQAHGYGIYAGLIKDLMHKENRIRYFDKQYRHRLIERNKQRGGDGTLILANRNKMLFKDFKDKYRNSNGFLEGSPRMALSMWEFYDFDYLKTKQRFEEEIQRTKQSLKNNDISAQIAQSMIDIYQKAENFVDNELKNIKAEHNGPGMVLELEVPEDNELLEEDTPLSKQPKEVQDKVNQTYEFIKQLFRNKRNEIGFKGLRETIQSNMETELSDLLPEERDEARKAYQKAIDLYFSNSDKTVTDQYFNEFINKEITDEDLSNPDEAINKYERELDKLIKDNEDEKYAKITKILQNAPRRPGLNVPTLYYVMFTEAEYTNNQIKAIDDVIAKISNEQDQLDRMSGTDIQKAISELISSMEKISVNGPSLLKHGINLGDQKDKVTAQLLSLSNLKGYRYNGGLDGPCSVLFDPASIQILNRYEQIVKQHQQEITRSYNDIKAAVIKAFPGYKSIKEEDSMFKITLPNNKQVYVDIKNNIILNSKELATAKKEHGIQNEDASVAGSWMVLDPEAISGLLSISKESEFGTEYHEAAHAVWDMALSDKEKQALMKYLKPLADKSGMSIEETFAEETRKWRIKHDAVQSSAIKQILQKVVDFINRMTGMFKNTGKFQDLMKKIETGEVWNNGSFISDKTADTTKTHYQLTKEDNTNESFSEQGRNKDASSIGNYYDQQVKSGLSKEEAIAATEKAFKVKRLDLDEFKKSKTFRQISSVYPSALDAEHLDSAINSVATAYGVSVDKFGNIWKGVTKNTQDTSNLSEEKLSRSIQDNSDAFKEWADGISPELKDEDGYVKLVYIGATKTGYDVINKTKAPKGIALETVAKNGVWGSMDRGVSDSYSFREASGANQYTMYNNYIVDMNKWHSDWTEEERRRFIKNRLGEDGVVTYDKYNGGMAPAPKPKYDKSSVIADPEDSFGTYVGWIRMKSPYILDFHGEKFNEYGINKYAITLPDRGDIRALVGGKNRMITSTLRDELGITKFFDTKEEAEQYAKENIGDKETWYAKKIDGYKGSSYFVDTDNIVKLINSSNKYDGAIFKNCCDSYLGTKTPTDNFWLKNEKDFKSIDNFGTFNENNESMLFSEQGNDQTTVGDERKLYEADHDKNLKSVTFTDKALNSSANRKKVEEYRRQRSTWKEHKNPDGSISFTRLHPQKYQDQKIVYNKINGRDVRSEPKKFRDQLQHLVTERAVRILFNDKEDLAQLARDSGVWDAYVKMMVLKDQGTAASSAILKGIVRKDGTRTMSLQQIVDNIGEDRQNDFLDYCIAYRVLDLSNRKKKLKNKDGSYQTNPDGTIKTESAAVFEKMTVEEAKKIIADVKKSKEADLFETNRKGFVDYNLELLHKLVDGGIITEKDYQTMKEVDPNFVPLNKKFDEDDADFIAVHKSLINAKKPFRKIKGGDHEVKNPIMEMEKRTLDYYSRAARNEAGAVFVKEIAKKVNIDETGKMVKMHGGVIRELNPHYDKRGIPTLKPDAKDMIFTVYDNGKKRFFQCADRDIYNALQSFNGNQISKWFQWMTWPKKALQWSATIVPDFGLRNFIRDNGEAFITSEHGFLPVVDSLWGMWQIKKDSDWFREYQQMNGELLTLNRLDDDVVSVSHNTGLREWYRMATNKNNSMKVRTQALLKVLGSPLMTLYTKNKRFNDYIELGTRIAEYKNARMGYEGIMNRVEKGDTGFGVKSLKTADVKNDEYYAAYMAKEITLNFGQHGELGKIFGPYVPFLNAALQGSYKTLRMFKEVTTDTQGHRLTLGLKMALVAMAAIGCATAGHGHKDYDEAPDWEKRSFWIFPNGFRIPKDQVFGRVIGNSVEAMASAYLSNKNPEYGKLISNALGEFIPDNHWPQLMTYMFGFVGNYDTFRDKPIVPVYMEDKLGYLQSDINTTNAAKDISKFLYEFSHGNVDFSAKKIDYGFQQTLSNLGKYITTMYDVGKSAAGFKISEKMDRGGELGILRDNKAFPANQITGTFVTNNSNYQSINDFYERYKELKTLSTGPADGYNKKEWERYKEAYKQDTKLRKALKDIKESTNLSGAEKRAKADPIFEKQIKLAKWASGVK